MKDKENSWKTLSKEQKLIYFKDYYLVKTICILVAVALIVYVCFNLLHKKETSLYVACIDEALQEKEVKKLEQQLEEALGNDGNHTLVMIDDSFYTSEDGIHKLEVLLSSKQIDLIIADEETFKQLAAYGFMQDLSQVMDKTTLEENKEKLIYTAGYKDNDEISFEDKETGQGEVLPYGLRIEKNAEYSELAGSLEHPVIGCAGNTQRQENAKKILSLIM